MQNYTLKLYAPINQINLPSPLNNIKSLKIKKVLYRFTTLNQHVLSIRVNGFIHGQNFDGIQPLNEYTLNLFNDGNLNALNYINNDGVADYFSRSPVGYSTISIQILVDGEYLVDVTQSNPILIELSFAE